MTSAPESVGVRSERDVHGDGWQLSKHHAPERCRHPGRFTRRGAITNLDSGDTTGLTFEPALVGAFGTGSPVPPGAPAGTTVINIPPGDGENGFYEVTFNLPSGFSAPQLSGSANVDDVGRVFLNGNPISPSIFSSAANTVKGQGNAIFSTSNAAFFQSGQNILLISDNNSGNGPSGAAFYATVTYSTPTASPPTGTVTFSDGSTSLGTASLSSGQATLAATSSVVNTVGTHTIWASYSGDTNYTISSASVLQTVNPARTTTTVTNADNPSVYGQSVTFTATCSGQWSVVSGQWPTGTVTFSDGSMSLGTGMLSGDIATYSTANLACGIHNIVASYAGDTNFLSSTSAPYAQTITYLFVVSTPPSPSPGVVAQGTTCLLVDFGRSVLGGDVAGNYELRSVGADGLLGTADDPLTTITASYTGTTATLSFAALGEDVYRLTVKDTITDSAGNPLDGDGDGTVGGNYVRDFVVSGVPPSMAFSQGGLNPGGMNPISVAYGDFNGDGNLNLVVANSWSNTVGVLLGNGTGGFGGATTFASGGSYPISVAVGDVNNDGNLDIVVAHAWSNNVGVLLGDGSGEFGRAKLYGTGGSNCPSVALGDVNNDGNLNLVVTNWDSNNVGVLLGTGTGAFGSATTFATGGSEPYSVAVADVNQDGNLNLVVGNYNSGNVGVLLGTGTGAFGSVTTFASGGSNPQSVAVADVNQDGNLNLVVANEGSSTVGVLLGSGTGTFGSATIFASGGSGLVSVAVADVNQDGNLNLVVANANSNNAGVLLGDGMGGFGSATTFATCGSGPFSVAVADVNNDGNLNLVVANSSSNTVGVLLGDGTGEFGSATTFASSDSSPNSMAVADVNHDGNLNLVVANAYSTNVGVLLGNGTGEFGSVTAFASGGYNPVSVAVADVNKDGNLDLIVTNDWSNNVGVLLGDGMGGFGSAATFATGGAYSESVAVADVNQDGNLDIVVANDHTVGVLLGNGMGGFGSVTTFPSGGPGTYSVAVADVNKDGNLNLVVANYWSDNVGVLLGTGTGEFGSPSTFASGGPNPRSVAVADVNKDGNLDIVVANLWGNNVGVLLGDGTGGFGSATTFASGDCNPQSVAVADVNKDGNLDIVVANGYRNDVGVLLGDGTGGFGSATTFASGGNNPDSVAVADVNKDGNLDLVVANYGSNNVAVLLGNGEPVVNLYTPNNFLFDIRETGVGAGQFLQGTDNAFDGYSRLQVGGSNYQPDSGPLGQEQTFLLDNGRTVVTPVQSMAGLNVHREITVPLTPAPLPSGGERGEDFARTVDVFENPTGSPITTTVHIVGNLGSDAATTVFAASDGDTIPDVNDQWIGTDDADGSGTPAIIHYIHGPAGLKPTAVNVTGDLNDNIDWTYTITVNPGTTLRLAMFTIVSTTRAGAMAAANALVTPDGFGCQAAAFLSNVEINSLANFRAETTTVLTSSVNPSVIGESLTFTATCSGQWSVVSGQWPTGTVTFRDGSTSLGTASLSSGQATLPSVFTTVGKHAITASYSGDTSFSSSSGSVVQSVCSTYTTTYTITNTSNSSTVMGSLPYALNLADSDTSGGAFIINFDPVVFATPQTIALAGSLNLANTTPGEWIIINGPAASLTIQGGGGGSDFSVLTVAADTTATLENLTISNGFVMSLGPNGSGIHNDGTLTVSNSTLSNNSSGYWRVGGGIYNTGTLTVSNSTLSGNAGYGGGGGIFNDGGTVTVSNSTLFGNSAPDSNGGGIFNSGGTVTVSNSTILNNWAGFNGGGIFTNSMLTLFNTIVAGNGRPGYSGHLRHRHRQQRLQPHRHRHRHDRHQQWRCQPQSSWHQQQPDQSPAWSARQLRRPNPDHGVAVGQPRYRRRRDRQRHHH